MKFFTDNSESKWIGSLQRDFSNFTNTDFRVTERDESEFHCRIKDQPSAPWMRKEFDVEDPAGAVLAICGLGYYEVYINGEKVGDHRLDPIVSVYDKRALYVTYDVSSMLKKGRNAIGVVLGTGWFDIHTMGPWVLEYAPWRDNTKMRLEIRNADGLLVSSKEGWKITRNGPIVYDALRAGEHYDARKELTGWSETGYDDSAWEEARIVRGPGGILQEQIAVPIRVVDTQELSGPNSKGVYDLGRNIAGHGRITVKGEAGAKVILQYTERVTADGDIDQNNQMFGGFDNTYWQYDEYTLKGSDTPEVWECRFAYHGFQYIRVKTEGDVTLQKLEARIVNSDFESIGSISCGNDMINTLQTLTRRSYLANFVGIPTDCPHREKNGWTGDAELASDTGLMNFDGTASYKEWIGCMRDCQRPDGDLPGIVPTGGWGYNWGNGPAWDCALFVIPWNVFVYTGDESLLKDSYENMKRYLDFLENNSIDRIVQFGLGDWCSDPAKQVTAELTNTAIYYGCLKMFVFCAARFGYAQDVERYSRLMTEVKESFHRHFYKGNGVWAEGEFTAMGTALYHGLCQDEAEKLATVQYLAKVVEEAGSKAYFGIIGAKYVPRVLADHGYTALAGRFFTQEEFPGWAHWVVADGATSLHEVWGTGASWNHIMFGDLSAWLYKYPGGLRFSETRPGWKYITIRPQIIPEWGSFRAEHRGYVCQWRMTDEKTVGFSITVPEGCKADVILPDGRSFTAEAGSYNYTSVIG